MQRKTNGQMEWLEFELLSSYPKIAHGVFLRPFNLATDLGENAYENRLGVLEALKIENLVSGYHVHGTRIENVKIPLEEFPDCDGLMTTHAKWGLLTLHADCQAAIFYDPVHHAIASVHAGWRGQVQNIYQKTVAEMAQNFGTRPEDLLVCISPSLGPANSEFKHYQTELPKEFWPFQIKPTYFDLWAIARHQLEACGVLSEHIEIAEIDTYANPNDFFSYRREKKDGKAVGNHGTVIALKSFNAKTPSRKDAGKK